MKYTLKATNFHLTASIENYLAGKLNSLDKFLSKTESIEVFVELAKTTGHHKKGNIFKAEVNIQVPGKLIRASTEEWDLCAAIDKVKDELQREIKKYKEKSRTHYKNGALNLKKLIKGEK